VELLVKFSTTDWERIEERFAAGELSIEQNMQEQFSHVPYDAPRLIEYARTVATIRPGWEEFVRFAERAGLKLAVVSGGLDFYVAALLPPADPPLDVHALRAEYTPEGWRVWAPPGEEAGGEPAEYKQAIVERYRRDGYERVWFIGNGVSDRGAARVADKVWAVEPLLSYCRTLGIAAAPFRTFHDVRADMEKALMAKRTP
jgi:2-hydroxy-3-keto-5-methylthiopentenyl-1-phosphate phosphatase